MTNDLFRNFDFRLLGSPDFKEDSVREEIIHPILTQLGYSASGINKIIRSRRVSHPYVSIGSRRKKLWLTPDYLLQVGGKNAWVLDAKAPNERIDSGKNVEQVYSYAIHPDIRVRLFALCNGKEFIVFSVEQKRPILHFPVADYANFYGQLHWFLSPQAFAESTPKVHGNKPAEHVVPRSEPDYVIEKRVGVLWSDLANMPAEWQTILFKGQLLAKASKEDVNGPMFYELYGLPDGRYLVYIEHIHRFDYCTANLVGANAFGEFDPPLTLERLQDMFPSLASKAGLARIRKLNID